MLGNAKSKEQFAGLDRITTIDTLNKLKPNYGHRLSEQAGFPGGVGRLGLVMAPITFEQFGDPTWAGVCDA